MEEIDDDVDDEEVSTGVGASLGLSLPESDDDDVDDVTTKGGGGAARLGGGGGSGLDAGGGKVLGPNSCRPRDASPSIVEV